MGATPYDPARSLGGSLYGMDSYEPEYRLENLATTFVAARDDKLYFVMTGKRIVCIDALG